MSKKRKPGPSDDPLLPPEVGHDLGLSHREWTRADHGRKHSPDKFDEFGRRQPRPWPIMVGLAIVLGLAILIVFGM